MVPGLARPQCLVSARVQRRHGRLRIPGRLCVHVRVHAPERERRERGRTCVCQRKRVCEREHEQGRAHGCVGVEEDVRAPVLVARAHARVRAHSLRVALRLNESSVSSPVRPREPDERLRSVSECRLAEVTLDASSRTKLLALRFARSRLIRHGSAQPLAAARLTCACLKAAGRQQQLQENEPRHWLCRVCCHCAAGRGLSSNTAQCRYQNHPMPCRLYVAHV
eukprot:5633373-Pleurochrysis_carterae.AAC.2